MARNNHVSTSIGSGNQPTRSTRSWTDANGVHYTVDSTSWSGPGISFGAMTGSANGGLRSFTAPLSSGRPRSGLFGNAFGLLDDLLSIQQRHHDTFVTSMGQGNIQAQQRRTQPQPQPRRGRVDVESDTDDDDMAYGNGNYENNRKPRPRSMFSKLKDRILDGKQRPRRSRDSSYERDQGHSRERSPEPPPRPQPERRRSSYRTETREPTWTQTQAPQERGRPDFIEVDYEEEDDEEVAPQNIPRAAHQANATLVEALESAVESERRAVRACKKRLEQAIRQPGTSSHYLQGMVDELKGHEKSLTDAQGNLDEARSRHKSSRPRPQSYHPRTSQSQQQPRPQQRQSTNFEEEFFSPFGFGFGSFPSPLASHQQSDPLFRAFEDLNSFGFGGRASFGINEQMFNDMRPQGQFRYFSSPNGVPPNAQQQRKRQRYSTPNGAGAGTQPNMGGFATTFPQPAPPPQPPAALLKPEEAKRLYKQYNERWIVLPASDPNIPYPARGLSANNLNSREAIWAPLCSAAVATWSEEDVMKANAQAFYLGVVSLAPEYRESPSSGRIEMGFDKNKVGSPAQVKALVEILKKERLRWHSDRLGKRNNGLGAGNVNEGLQRDVRARAVFHAVCELIESASE